MNSKERFLAACFRKPYDRPPVWLMRQAGRYLPEYRLLRSRHDFIELCKNPELSVEATMQPLERFRLDAAIIFSDILFVPEAMGQTLTFNEGEGPRLSPVISSPDDLSGLKKPDVLAAFKFLSDAVTRARKKISPDIPLIGFVGGPYTLAKYMTRDNAKGWVRKHPEALKELLEKITDVLIDVVELQSRSGADVIQIFDTWAGELSDDDYKKFALPYVSKVIAEAKACEPFILYCRKCGHILEAMASSGAQVLSIDPETSIEDAIAIVGERVALQGNLDPKLLLTTPGFVKQETSRLLSKIGGRRGHIINLGHGILQTSLPECVEAMVDTVIHGGK